MTEPQTQLQKDKQVIREVVRQVRATLDAKWVPLASAHVQQRAIALPEFVKAKVVFCYLAAGSEVHTESILRAAWRAGKRVCVPAGAPHEGRYRRAWLESKTALVVGQYGICEPKEIVWAEGAAVEIAFIPGMAFDAEGGRVGHGQGNYDRLLADPDLRGARKVGLAFEYQMVKAAPGGPHDIRLDAVITEETTYRGGLAEARPVRTGRK